MQGINEFNDQKMDLEQIRYQAELKIVVIVLFGEKSNHIQRWNSINFLNVN